MSITIERPSLVPNWLPTSQFPFRHQFMNVDGRRMHYVDEGVGEPIVFLHGLPAWSFVFRHLIRGLSGLYRCIAPDMLGFGLSEKPAEWSYSLMDQCVNLGRFLDELGLESVTLAMHDYGVAIGTAYAVEHPSRIKRLTVMNGICWDPKEDPTAGKMPRLAAGPCGKMLMTSVNNWPRIVHKGFHDRSKYSDALNAAVTGATSSKEDRLALWKSAKGLASAGPFLDDVWRRRRELADVPIQFIWGMKDPIYEERGLNKWWQEFPLSPVERLRSVGHFPMEEKPAEVLDSMKLFLAAPLNASYMA